MLFQLKEIAGYPEDIKRIPKAFAPPPVIGRWMKTSRDWVTVQQAVDVAAYPDLFRNYWDRLNAAGQPPEQSSAAEQHSSICTMTTSGPNGLILVLLLLYWWRCVAKHRADRTVWKKAVGDVLDVFQHLLEQHLSAPDKPALPPSPALSDQALPIMASQVPAEFIHDYAPPGVARGSENERCHLF
ncbi:hypothetical protein BD626DRAFT_569536 [Schizophyllum amplum]|uniref:Uncharacterized protein n=1 Tax=Schizophyllum amplum TaxID=97359 RepID=A0A550CDT7_9AGAR|nr:hypothetical protein BD626DRAFT_569536 [Auriculariopsis ampla]